MFKAKISTKKNNFISKVYDYFFFVLTIIYKLYYISIQITDYVRRIDKYMIIKRKNY